MQLSGWEEELYKIKTIAHLSGFSPTLLRAWERRYGLLVPKRTPTGHRLYTADDLQVLRKVRVQLDRGRTIGEIVAQGRSPLLDSPPQVAPDGESTSELGRISRATVRAALSLDEVELAALLDRAFAAVSPAQALEQVVVPAAHEIGQLWSDNEASVAAEHLLTLHCQRRLHRLIEASPRQPTQLRAMSACFPDDLHELGMLMVTFYLLRLGLSVSYLGASLPIKSLGEALSLRPVSFVFLSVSQKQLLDQSKAELIELVAAHPRVRFVLGGAAVIPESQTDLTAHGILLWPSWRRLDQLPATLGLS